MSGPRIPRWPSNGPTPHTWRDANCANDERMFELERKQPWVLLVYALALVAACALSAFFPWGFAS